MRNETTEEVSELLEIDSTEESPQPGTETPAAKPVRSESDETLKEMRRALKESRTALRETNEMAKFWMAKAQGGATAQAEAEPEPTTSVDLVEAITNNDAKAVAKALREMGVAFSTDVDGKIHAARTAVGKDAELYDRFPDLADSKSDLFLETAKVYNDLARRDPALAKSGVLAEVAAELAEKRLNGSDPAPRRPQPDFDVDDDEEADDREAERVRRVRAQSGDRGRRTSSRASGDSDALDATQKTIVAKLRAAGADISEEGYRKRAQSGVRMSGLPTRKARY